MFEYVNDSHYIKAADLVQRDNQYLFQMQTDFAGSLEIFEDIDEIASVGVGFNFMSMLSGEPPMLFIELKPGLSRERAERVWRDTCHLIKDACLTEHLLRDVDESIFALLDEPYHEAHPNWWLLDAWLKL